MLKGLGGLADMGKMMTAAQEMEAKMGELQEKLNTMTVVGESGAGLVKATSTAKGELTGLDIDPSIFNPDEKEVVEDLILAAIKDAQSKATEKHKEEMSALTESLGLPADLQSKLPFLGRRPVHRTQRTRSPHRHDGQAAGARAAVGPARGASYDQETRHAFDAACGCHAHSGRKRARMPELWQHLHE